MKDSERNACNAHLVAYSLHMITCTNNPAKLKESASAGDHNQKNEMKNMMLKWVKLQVKGAERSVNARILAERENDYLVEIDSSNLVESMPWNWKGFLLKGSFDILTK